MKKTAKTKDFLRGYSKRDITIRFDPDNLELLPCHCKYDPDLSTKERNKEINKVMLLKEVEIQNKDGSWSPYPSITWLMEVEDEDQFLTKALVRLTGEKEITVVSSSNWGPDSVLMDAAREVGIYTETIEA